MISKRLVFFAVVLVLIAFWFVSRPSRHQFSQNDSTKVRKPSGQIDSSTDALSGAAQDADESLSAQNDPRRPNFTSQARTENMHERIRQARKLMRGEQMDLRQSPYLNYRERLDAKAAPAKSYNSANNPSVQQIGGYAVYKTSGAASTLNDFDGKQLPIVVDDQARMGVVNGDIRVTFKSYPANIQAFADTYDLKIVKAVEAIKLAFFTPKTLPAAIVDRVARISNNPIVKKADLDIVFRTPVGH